MAAAAAAPVTYRIECWILGYHVYQTKNMDTLRWWKHVPFVNVTIITIILLWLFSKKARTVTHTLRDQPRVLGIIDVEVTGKRQWSDLPQGRCCVIGHLKYVSILGFFGSRFFKFCVTCSKKFFGLTHNNDIYSNHFVKETYWPLFTCFLRSYDYLGE